MEKSNKGLVVTIVILIVLLLGVLGYVYYDKFYLKDDNEETVRLEKKKPTNEEINTLNNYSTFVENLKKDRAKEEEGIVKSYDEYTASAFDSIGIRYTINLTNDGVLSINYYDDYNTYGTNLDTGVLFFRLAYAGNGGFRVLYYVKEDGKVYSSGVEYAPYEKRKPTVNKFENGCKEIVNILPSAYREVPEGAGGVEVSFVDINGNICK